MICCMCDKQIKIGQPVDTIDDNSIVHYDCKKQKGRK